MLFTGPVTVGSTVRVVRRQAALVVAITLLIVGAGVGIGIALTSDGNQPTVNPFSTAASKASYCGVAREALEYEGHSAARRAQLLDRTLRLSPPELVSTLKTIRKSSIGSNDYVAAHRLWDYYNNNHCCNCLDRFTAPEIYELTPLQRKHIETGKPL